MLKSIKVTRNEHTEYSVEDGMTRSIRSDKNTTSTGLGVTFVKHESKIVTVTPLR